MGGIGEDEEESGGGDNDPGNAMLRAIEAQRLKREARAAAIERGEIVVEDPREAREKAMKAQKRPSMKPQASRGGDVTPGRAKK